MKLSSVLALAAPMIVVRIVLKSFPLKPDRVIDPSYAALQEATKTPRPTLAKKLNT
jgi:hypothetical protein